MQSQWCYKCAGKSMWRLLKWWKWMCLCVFCDLSSRCARNTFSSLTSCTLELDKLKREQESASPAPWDVKPQQGKESGSICRSNPVQVVLSVLIRGGCNRTTGAEKNDLQSTSRFWAVDFSDTSHRGINMMSKCEVGLRRRLIWTF